MSGSLKTNARLIADCHAFWKVRFAAKDTGQRVQKFATVVCGLALLAGCTLENQLMTTPQTSGKAGAPVEPDDSDRLGNGCELKNPDGSGTCDDGRGVSTKAKLTRDQLAETDPRLMAEFRSNLEKCNNKRLTDGDNKKVNALLAQGRFFDAYEICAKSQDVPRASESRPTAPAPEYSTPASQTGGGSVPQDGTWYCDNLTGSGQYGTWEMTQHPEVFDVASCYRVD